ncbi:MAG TPA: protein kinase UbiB [Hyphomicrobiaceae bacterium MAG_BT-2024]
MILNIINFLRIARACIVLSKHGVRFIPKGFKVPLALHLVRILTWPIQILLWPFQGYHSSNTKVSKALSRLGPSYIKLGQFIATRSDLIDPKLAEDLRNLQDRQPSFSMREARRTITESLGGLLEDHFLHFSLPVAAASIAQVHKARVNNNDSERDVAVKILRPGIRSRFQRDLDSYFFAARMIERFYPSSRRLRPVAVIENLKKTTTYEMDLRLEGAAISKMADNIRANESFKELKFRVPEVNWRLTSEHILTLEWIEGTPISMVEKLRKEGHDLKALSLTVLRSFLYHVMHDGFFHADMHQGNLLVEPNGTVVAVDFGIMGHLSKFERRFLAEILHGLITRNYNLAAQVHFDAGYVPTKHSVTVFAQAMRAIGEPIHGCTASEISMAKLLSQLFAYTDLFDMETRPELILLQKSMVIVEGVARSLDPHINIWTAAQPVAEEWIKKNYSIRERISEAGQFAEATGQIITQAPRLLEHIDRSVCAFTKLADNGICLNSETIRRIAQENSRYGKTRLRMMLLILFLLVTTIWITSVI